MTIKTSCVRCGARIEGPGVYCDSCASAKSFVTQGENPPRRSRSPLRWALVLLLAGMAGLAFVLRDDAPPETSVPEVARPGLEEAGSAGGGQAGQATPVPAESAADGEAASAPQEAAQQAGEESVGPDAPTAAPKQDTAAQEQAQAQEVASAASAEEAAPPDPAESGGTQEAATSQKPAAAAESETHGAAGDVREAAVVEEPESGESALSEATAPVSPAPEIWIYYANDPGKDERYADILEESGYAGALAKGAWETKYPLNYIFYRPKDKQGLERLAAVLDELDFTAFHHLDSATSPRLRGYFADNPQLEFLLILQ